MRRSRLGQGGENVLQTIRAKRAAVVGSRDGNDIREMVSRRKKFRIQPAFAFISRRRDDEYPAITRFFQKFVFFFLVRSSAARNIDDVRAGIDRVL